MRVPSGSTNCVKYFYAQDAMAVEGTPVTGLSSFTVIGSRNGGADATWTTPTITEIDAVAMPGVYALLLDEQTTLDAGFDEQELILQITAAGMRDVLLIVELFRPKGSVGADYAEVDVMRVNGDADAAANLEAMYNGTGYTHATAPAARSQATAIDAVTSALGAAAASLLGQSVLQMLLVTVDDAALTPTTTQFETNAVEATPNHYKNRTLIFTTGALAKQAQEITAYSLVGGRGRFTVGGLTEAPADGDQFLIV